MGRKKRRGGEKERIYCYYCERDFASEHELVHHQKEKHLRCPTCHKRMVSISGLVVHAMQVHKRTVTVPHAIEGREDPKVDVYGMQGIPEDRSHRAKRYQVDTSQRTSSTYPTAGYPAPSTMPVPRANPQFLPVQPYHAGTYGGQAPAYQGYPPRAPVLDRSQFVAQKASPHSALASPYAAYPSPGVAHVPTLPAWVTRGSAAPPQLNGVRILTPVTPAPTSGLNTPDCVSPAFSGTVVAHTSPASHEVGGGARVSSAGQAFAKSPAVRAGPVVSSSKKKPVQVVFDREDVCMEELRALLPRYRKEKKEVVPAAEAVSEVCRDK